MRVGFAGTPAFAATALAAILDGGFDVAVALTRPDRPRGRGMKLEPSPVKALALARALPVLQPPSLRSAEALGVPLDVLVVAAYGLILPPEVLAWPRYGCLNIHASLLPRWRGAAPIQRAIEAGDRETGVTLMQMDEGLDTGPMIEQVRVPIGDRDTAGTLESALASAGASAMVRALGRLAENGRLRSTPQPADGVTYATKIDRAEAAIDWWGSAAAIARKVRALDPVPGALASLGGEPVKVWRAEPAATAAAVAAPGTVLAASRDGIVVVCGSGLVRILEIQPAARRRMSVADFLPGHAVAPGDRFDATVSATGRGLGGANG